MHIVSMQQQNSLWRRGCLLDDADEGYVGSPVNVVLVTAQDEGHRAHHIKVHLAGYYPRPC